MKAWTLGLGVLLVGLLVGCGPRIERTYTTEQSFVNRPDITYDVTMNVLSDQNSVRIEQGYYMPEVELLCFDLMFLSHQDGYIYTADVAYEDDATNTQGVHSYHGIGPEDDGQQRICFPHVQYDRYTILISRYLERQGAKTLATIEYVDPDFDQYSGFDLRIANKETNTIAPTEEPFVRFDLSSKQDPRDIPGNLYLRLFDGRDIYAEQPVDTNAFTYDGTNWVLEDVTFDGLVPGYAFLVQLAYRPEIDSTETFAVGERNSDLFITSASMEGLSNDCPHSYLCAMIYDAQIQDDTVVFQVYAKSEPPLGSSPSTPAYKIYFLVFDESHNETFRIEVIDRQVSVPLEYLMGEHRIELESDLLVQIEDPENDFYDSYYLDLDVRYVVDGVLYGNGS
jgi:hypothetical protein